MEVFHDTAAQQFHVDVDGHRGVIDYTLRDDLMTIEHTKVPEAIEGHGVAAELTRVALETARSNCWKVVPECSYAAAYIRRHPEYKVLLCDHP